MPREPGSFPVIMHIHAGTVIGGVALSSLPKTPFAMTLRRFGRRSPQSSKTSSGAAQSNPMMNAFFFLFADVRLEFKLIFLFSISNQLSYEAEAAIIIPIPQPANPGAFRDRQKIGALLTREQVRKVVKNLPIRLRLARLKRTSLSISTERRPDSRTSNGTPLNGVVYCALDKSVAENVTSLIVFQQVAQRLSSLGRKLRKRAPFSSEILMEPPVSYGYGSNSRSTRRSGRELRKPWGCFRLNAGNCRCHSEIRM